MRFIGLFHQLVEKLVIKYIVWTYPILVHSGHVFVHLINLAHHSSFHDISGGTSVTTLKRRQLGVVNNAWGHLLGNTRALLELLLSSVLSWLLLIWKHGERVLCKFHICIKMIQTLVVRAILFCGGSRTNGENVGLTATSNSTTCFKRVALKVTIKWV